MTREMIEPEHALCTKSTRSTFIYWQSVRDMLWTHKSPDLEHVYETLVARLRQRSRRIKRVLLISEGRKAAKQEQLSRNRRIAEINKKRREAHHV